MRSVYVGIDGGGTHARAVATDGEGNVLARVTGGPGLVDPRDPGGATAVVSAVTREILELVGATRASALCCGLAGAGRQQEREAVRVGLALEDVADVITVIGDAEAAMADAFPSGAGVLVIAGTGSIAWAQAADGLTRRVGGWGQILGDEGSGYAIGLGALRRVVRAEDRGESTSLSGRVLEHAKLASTAGLVPWVASASKAEIASLAPHVLRAAAEGDRNAVSIRDEAIAALLDLVITAAAHAGSAPAIAFGGGLISPGGPLREVLVAEVSRALPGATVLERAVDAAAGAAHLARLARPGA